MTEYTQEEAVFRMNEMGKAGRPFLFIIAVKRERLIVGSPEVIVPSEFLADGGITSKSYVRSEYTEMKQKVYVPIY